MPDPVIFGCGTGNDGRSSTSTSCLSPGRFSKRRLAKVDAMHYILVAATFAGMVWDEVTNARHAGDGDADARMRRGRAGTVAKAEPREELRFRTARLFPPPSRRSC